MDQSIKQSLLYRIAQIFHHQRAKKNFLLDIEVFKLQTKSDSLCDQKFCLIVEIGKFISFYEFHEDHNKQTEYVKVFKWL